MSRDRREEGLRRPPGLGTVPPSAASQPWPRKALACAKVRHRCRTPSLLRSFRLRAPRYGGQVGGAGSRKRSVARMRCTQPRAGPRANRTSPASAEPYRFILNAARSRISGPKTKPNRRSSCIEGTSAGSRLRKKRVRQRDAPPGRVNSRIILAMPATVESRRPPVHRLFFCYRSVTVSGFPAVAPMPRSRTQQRPRRAMPSTSTPGSRSARS